MLSRGHFLQVDIGGIFLSYTWTNLTQGRYEFFVSASTLAGEGKRARLMLSILPNNGKFVKW